jgi:hypothetical protein
MATELERDELIESEDAGDIGALVIRAADQLTFAGPGRSRPCASRWRTNGSSAL